jgi:hypothetical protein
MPITYHIDPEGDLVLVTCSGVVTDNEFPQFREQLMNDPHFHPGMKELADFRSVERYELTMDGFIDFIENEKAYISRLKDYKIAVVTSSDLHFGFTRMYMSMMSDQLGDVQVFRDIEEAKTWLLNDDE